MQIKYFEDHHIYNMAYINVMVVLATLVKTKSIMTQENMLFFCSGLLLHTLL
jgi:hypothetical protein